MDQDVQKYSGKGQASLMLRLHTIQQLFESMDPSPFIERDLDSDAEAFIVSWAREYPHAMAFTLTVHIAEKPPMDDYQEHIRQGVRNYFGYRAEIARHQFRQLLRTGRSSAIIGVVALAGCLFAAHILRDRDDSPLTSILTESFVILGWVAMWRPVQIFLYDWWPLRATRKLYERLADMEVEVMPGWAQETIPQGSEKKQR